MIYMSIPKLEFQISPISMELNTFKRHLLSQQRSQGLLKLYPDLEELIDKFIINKQETLKIKMQDNIIKYSNFWETKSDSIFKNLELIIGTPFTQKNFIAYLSMDLTCPRYLDYDAFNVFYNFDQVNFLETCAHELTHFLYFKKFKELFPNISERNYNAPYLEWVLSEILVGVILNDFRFEGLFNMKPKSYTIFYEKKIGKKTIMQVFEDKYKQMIEKEHKKFNDYLIWAYDYAKKHEKQLMVVN